MKIKINDKLLYIIFETNAEEKLITKFTEYKDTSSAFAGGHYNPMFVTNKKLGKIIKGIFVSYAGLAKEIICYCKDMDIKITEYKDERTHYDFQKEEFDLKSFFDPKHKYVEHQTRALAAMLQTNTGIIKATTSAGKCLGKGTEILLYDGTIKKVEDIEVGDKIMGYDSTPRNVLSTTSGIQKLYKLKFNKNNEEFIVNSSHILSLKASWDMSKKYKKGFIEDINIEEYLLKNKEYKRCMKSFKVPVTCWEEKEVSIEPYFLGLWLGDGSSRTSSITTMDKEILEVIEKEANERKLFVRKQSKKENKASAYYITSKVRDKRTNSLMKDLRSLNLIGNKHIPTVYKINSESKRLDLLAGLLDADGYLCDNRHYEIASKYKNLANDIVFLARSLGLNATLSERKKICYNNSKEGLYYIIYISGDIYKIPTRLKRKQAKKSNIGTDVLQYGFCVEDLGEGEYYGFELDGDGRFVLGNFFVTHNTSIVSAYIRATNMPTLILVNKVTLAQQLQNSFIKDGIDCGICTGQGIKSGTCMVSTIQSVKKVPNLLDYKCLIVDEIHQGSSTSFQEFFGSVSYPYKFGFSATPEGSNDYKFALVRQFFGSIIEEIGAEELMKNEVIAIPDINFIPVECPQTMHWQSAYEQAIVFNKDRNKKIIELVNQHDVPTLILIRIIDHGEELQKLIPDSVFVNGKDTSPKERMRVIEKFEKGEIKVVISSNIFNEGVSITNIHMLIIASGMKGYTESSQKLGRALRIGDDKKTALVYDFLDKGNRFTEKHSKRRASIYKKAGFKVSISK